MRTFTGSTRPPPSDHPSCRLMKPPCMFIFSPFAAQEAMAANTQGMSVLSNQHIEQMLTNVRFTYR